MIQQDWVAICLAPIDGRPILAIDARDGFAQVVQYAEDKLGRGYVWQLRGSGSSFHETAFTHFMPIPAPPERHG